MENRTEHIEKAKAYADAWRAIADVVENNPDPLFLEAMSYGLDTITAPVGTGRGARERILAVAEAFGAAGFEFAEWSDESSGGIKVKVGPVTISAFANRRALADYPPPPVQYRPLLGGAVES